METEAEGEGRETPSAGKTSIGAKFASNQVLGKKAEEVDRVRLWCLAEHGVGRAESAFQRELFKVIEREFGT